ncbi:MAG: hypothetical protein ABSG43_20935, partial [Solirubrobacteraceae bacterium]
MRGQPAAVTRVAAISFVLSVVAALAYCWPAATALAAGGGAPAPKLGVSIVVQRLGGTVLVTVPGRRPSPLLAQRRAVPVGSTVDTTRGQVKLVTAGVARASTQFGVFGGGAFVVAQQRSSALTLLTLVGGRPQRQVCAAAARAASVSSTVLRLLRARAHGM